MKAPPSISSKRRKMMKNFTSILESLDIGRRAGARAKHLKTNTVSFLAL